MMARSRRQPAKSHRAQFPAQCLLGDADPELLPEPLAEIDDPPAHHAVDRRDRPAFERRGQRRAEPVIEPRRLTRRLAVDQAIRALGVELDDPVPNDCRVTPPIWAASARVAPA